MLAIANAQHWPEYADTNGYTSVKCVVITRDPFARVKSLYAYVYDGSELDLQRPSEELRTFDKMSDGLDYLYTAIIKDTLMDSHRFLMLSLKRKECQRVAFEEFEADFDSAAKKWLDHWGIRESAQGKLINIMQKHDVKRKTPEERSNDHHLSGKSFSKQKSMELESVIRAHVELWGLIQSQRRDLKYAL